MGSARGSWANTEVTWPSLDVREGFLEEATTEWKLKGQWSQSEEVLFQQRTVSAKVWTAWRSQSSGPFEAEGGGNGK